MSGPRIVYFIPMETKIVHIALVISRGGGGGGSGPPVPLSGFAHEK